MRDEGLVIRECEASEVALLRFADSEVVIYVEMLWMVSWMCHLEVNNIKGYVLDEQRMKNM
jgi:hypothetical protein